MYYCKDCGKLFEEPAKEYDVVRIYANSRGEYAEEMGWFDICPDCGSSDIEEPLSVFRCKKCGAYYHPEHMPTAIANVADSNECTLIEYCPCGGIDFEEE